MVVGGGDGCLGDRGDWDDGDDDEGGGGDGDVMVMITMTRMLVMKTMMMVMVMMMLARTMAMVMMILVMMIMMMVMMMRMITSRSPRLGQTVTAGVAAGLGRLPGGVGGASTRSPLWKAKGGTFYCWGGGFSVRGRRCAAGGR